MKKEDENIKYKSKKINSTKLDILKNQLTGFCIEDNITKTFVVISTEYKDVFGKNKIFKTYRLVGINKKDFAKRVKLKYFKKEKMTVLLERSIQTRNAPVREFSELMEFKEEVEQYLNIKLGE